MRLRGRVDVARAICDEKCIKTSSPLVVVCSDDRLYCLYKLRLYELELNYLLTTYSITKDIVVREEIEYFIQCSKPLCDFSIERGVPVDTLYHIIEGYYSLL